MTPIRPSQPGAPDSAALLRFVSGQSTLPEAEAIRNWLAADPARQVSIDELRAAWQSTPTAVPAWDRAGVWARLSAELSSATPAEPAVTLKPRGTRRFAVPSS